MNLTSVSTLASSSSKEASSIKDLLYQLAAYNLWANQQLLDAILQLSDQKHRQEIASSFSSIHKTVLHMWNAESIWWQRMKLLERITVPADNFQGDMKELSSNLLHQDRDWLDWISVGQEHHLQHVFQYQNSKKEQFKQPIYQMLLHLFNHGTYHRGQLVTMLRQLGVERIPETDFIVWSRAKR